jgi:AraC-like DNA-binding protein/quercetin dioxygenase-like cupin family protein
MTSVAGPANPPARKAHVADLGQVLALDREVTSHVRVRSWRDRFGGRQSWRATAHSGVEVAFVEAGGLSYRVGSLTIEVRPGQAIVVPPHVEHASTLAAGTRARSLWLGVGMVEEIAAAMGARLARDPLLIPRADRVCTLSEMITAEAAGEGPGKVIAVEALAEALAIDVLRSTQTDPLATVSADRRVNAALDKIHESYAEPLDVDALARVAALSRFHFSRLFREQVGMSPYQYLVKVRVERAAELLRQGRRSVTEAALEVGFQDLGRFARAFARRFGCRPSEVRRPGRPAVLVSLPARYACR